ncbi:MAG: hypothetical protein WD963_01320 [Candidatus Paceibacterota bacterium]
MKKNILYLVFGSFCVVSVVLLVFPKFFSSATYYPAKIETEDQDNAIEIENEELTVLPPPPLDTVDYDERINALANNPPPKIITETVTVVDENGVEVKETVPLDPQPAPPPTLWPVKTVYPNAGAILPFNRIIAYYGNLYSPKMGALGQYPEDEMLARLDVEVKKWESADPSTPVLPALHYIVVVARDYPTNDGKYRGRMPSAEVDKVLKMAEKINAIVFLDFQVGFSTLAEELPVYEKYFKMPNVHLGIDPEFSMKGEIRPGKVVGTVDATDVNFAANYLAKVVRENNLTPKILVVHRYTQGMVTNYQNIKPLPEVQIVMHMDGWGGAAKKRNTYQQFVYKEPVQFTGFKLFYRHDVAEPGTVLMSPADLLKLQPRPIYIQYQ